MATPVIMPRQGQSVESCIIAKWHKQKGDMINPGDILFTYETDKATFDEEAKEEGILLDVFFEEGDDVPVLTNVCVIGKEGEDASQFDPRGQDKKEEQGDNDKTGQVEDMPDTDNTSDNQTSQPTSDQRIKISPRAKNLAKKVGVDHRYANPTGPYGRIIERDIIKLMESGPVITPAARDEYMAIAPSERIEGTGLGGRVTTGDLNKIGTVKNTPSDDGAFETQMPEYQEVKVSNIRKVIAKAMHHSLSTTAQLTLNTSFDATDILDFRKKLKSKGEKFGLGRITLNDIILYAVSRTLLNHKELNAHFLDDKMLLFNNVNLGVAVDTERGLMVPTIFNANLKSLAEIASEVKDFAEECQKGTISPDKLKGGSFTVTNLGALGIESFTPVLNPPQTGILGVNTIMQRAREVDGKIEYYPAMGLSLTFDHRAVDGAPAARFLKELKENLENFSVILAK